MRLCGRCGEHPARGKSQRWCSDCHAAYQRKYREATITMRHERRLAGTFDVGPLCGVYFIQCDGFIKIGMAGDVIRRLSQIKASNPHVVTPLGFIPAKTYDEAERIEKDMHSRFAATRGNGEWFIESRELLEFAAKNISKWSASDAASTWNAVSS